MDRIASAGPTNCRAGYCIGEDHVSRLAAPRDVDPATSEMGLVSRGTPVQTALRNCTRDEGRPFEFGNQVLISSHRKLLWSKAMVVNVAEKTGLIPSGMVERGERKRT